MAERDITLKQLVGFLECAPVYPNQMPYPETGERKWTIFKGRPWPQRVLVDGTYPYAVLANAELRLAQLPRPIGKIHHPELVKGKDVIAAGMLVLRDGEVATISNESGHYCPEPDSLNYALLVLRHWQVPLSQKVILDGSWNCR